MTAKEFGIRRRSKEFEQVYELGLSHEAQAVELLRGMGYDVVTCQDKESQNADTDFLLDGVPTSFKSQQTGARYGKAGHICCELMSQRGLYGFNERYLSMLTELNAIGYHREYYHTGWFLHGQAQQYAIWQGSQLYIYSKDELWNAARSGFVRICGLSAKVLAVQGYLDTISGYLEVADLNPLRTHEVVNVSNACSL